MASSGSSIRTVYINSSESGLLIAQRIAGEIGANQPTSFFLDQSIFQLSKYDLREGDYRVFSALNVADEVLIVLTGSSTLQVESPAMVPVSSQLRILATAFACGRGIPIRVLLIGITKDDLKSEPSVPQVVKDSPVYEYENEEDRADFFQDFKYKAGAASSREKEAAKYRLKLMSNAAAARSNPRISDVVLYSHIIDSNGAQKVSSFLGHLGVRSSVVHNRAKMSEFMSGEKASYSYAVLLGKNTCPGGARFLDEVFSPLGERGSIIIPVVVAGGRPLSAGLRPSWANRETIDIRRNDPEAQMRLVRIIAGYQIHAATEGEKTRLQPRLRLRAPPKDKMETVIEARIESPVCSDSAVPPVPTDQPGIGNATRSQALGCCHQEIQKPTGGAAIAAVNYAVVEVFYSYSHQDEKLRDRLVSHLSLLKRQGVIVDWHDRKITAGREWQGQIDEHLNSARLVLLLVSASFLASEYCYNAEFNRAFERHEKGEARVIPIILKPVDWQSAPFAKLQALPKDGKPITKWTNRDEAFADVAAGIRAAVAELRKPINRT